jgi:hypothetical protein
MFLDPNSATQAVCNLRGLPGQGWEQAPSPRVVF